MKHLAFALVVALAFGCAYLASIEPTVPRTQVTRPVCIEVPVAKQVDL